MTAKILKFREPNFQSVRIPNSVEEAKVLVEDSIREGFGVSNLLEFPTESLQPPKAKQHLRSHWPFQNRWQTAGVAVALVGHLITWVVLWYLYH